MEDLLAESKIELLKEGSVISGTIMEIRPTEVVIDFGGKAEGTIPAHEFIDPSELEIGSDIEVFLELFGSISDWENLWDFIQSIFCQELLR